MSTDNANSYKYQVIRAIERKLYLINLRGGKCEKCGYCKNLSAFDFHHKDPSEKEDQLDTRKLSNSTMDWILKEFEKCLVLCANCHREEHNPNLKMNLVLERVSEFKNATKVKRKVCKPKCVDCGIEVNYTHKRCNKCEGLNRTSKNKPPKDLLIKEVEQYGKRWCAKKYNVARITISRWMNNAPLAQPG